MVANPIHIVVDGTKITASDIENSHAIVTITTDVENEGMYPQTTMIVTKIIDADGNIVAVDKTPFTVFAAEKATTCQCLYVR